MSFAETRQRWAVAITAWADAIAMRVARALPWSFLALRRALIPTLVWLVVAALFFVVPQSREVLHGLSEPVLRSFTQFDPTDQTSINLWALISYVATAVALGLAIWYAARLLCTVDADRGAPNALEVEPGAARLKQATRWYPRGLGVSALAAAIGALMYANYTPALSQWPALGLAVLALAGPLLLVIGRLLRRRRAPSAAATGCMVLGALALLAACMLLWLLHDKWPMRLWCMGAATLPALLLWFLVQRRDWLAARSDDERVRDAAVPQTFGSAIFTLLLLVAGSLSALLALWLLPPLAMRIVGTAAAALLFLGASALLLSGLHLLLRRVASNVPGFTAALLGLLAVGVALIGGEDLGDESLDDQPAARLNRPAAGPGSAASAPAATLMVNAHGGGLRAAVFTAQVLARADDASCGEFGQRVGAFSGASGGSLGIATYLLARQELLVREGGWPRDCNSRESGAPAKAPLTDIVTQALVQDHLSPVISRMLAVDAPHLPWAPVRGQALLDSWNGALIDALQTHYAKDKLPVTDIAAFALPLRALTGGFAVPPAVYFNATDSDTGHIVWFSNRDGGVVATHKRRPQPLHKMSVGQAVLHSARFPIVTPAGGFVPPWDAKATLARLIDGGYADNSGTTTLFDEAAMGLRLVDIDGNHPHSRSLCKDELKNEPERPPLLTAVRGLLQARTAHAESAVERLAGRRDAQRIGVQFNLVEVLEQKGHSRAAACLKVKRAQQAPLGWYLSYGAASVMATSARLGVERICDQLSIACRAAEVAPLAD